VALAGQSMANLETAKVATKAVAVAQTANTSNLVLVGVVGCVGGGAFLAVLALAGVAAFLWYKLQLEQRQAQQRQRPAMLPQPQGAAQVMAGDLDFSWLQDDNWVAQGEELWTQNDSLHW